MKSCGLWGVVALLACSCSKGPSPQELHRPVHLAVPDQGAYTGAYIDFGEQEDDVTLEAIEQFEDMVGKRQAIVASSSWWGEQTFPARNVEIISRHGAVPLIYWSPWDRPYTEGTKPDRFSLTHILAGDCDKYIIEWGRQAKACGHPLMVAWGLEMNGDWFPWSGLFYGGGKMLSSGPKPRYVGPELYKQAYHHVVDLVRAQGAANIQWVFHANNSSNPMEPWNQMAPYYPGSAYVDWLAISAYGQQYPKTGWVSVKEVFAKGLRDLCALDPAKPVMLAEWGVGEFPGSGNRAAWLTEAFAYFKTQPRLKAAVFWHERWPNGEDSYSNLRVNASQASLQAYRKAMEDPYWLDRPQYSDTTNR